MDKEEPCPESHLIPIQHSIALWKKTPSHMALSPAAARLACQSGDFLERRTVCHEASLCCTSRVNNEKLAYDGYWNDVRLWGFELSPHRRSTEQEAVNSAVVEVR
jgi:hypothetical protein